MTRFLTSPTPLLRGEGGILFALGLLLYWKAGGNWFALLGVLFVPDLSMLGYLGGARVGAVTYNLAHVTVGPAVVAALGIAGGNGKLLAIALIWFTHINLDRMLGYGLKRPTEFKDTHLTSTTVAPDLHTAAHPVSSQSG